MSVLEPCCLSESSLCKKSDKLNSEGVLGICDTRFMGEGVLTGVIFPNTFLDA